MQNRIIIGLLFVVSSFFISSIGIAAQPTESVVKIFVTTNRMDFYRPWQSQGVSSSSGSGAIISENRILTNAHVVTDQTFIQVKKHADPKKYTAKVVAIAQDCDLAMLEVVDQKFFEGTRPLKMGDLPQLQDTVTVIGFPQGGEKLSITEGVVSRIEVSSYSQSARQLLAVQIDAAINPGNSGGPVVQDGKLVGIAMQVLNAGQNIGYMIPVPIINHFFEDLKDGKYDGFPMIGLNYMNTENTNMRRYYGLDKVEGGVVVTKLLPYSSAYGNLQEEDVILEVDGVKIGEDGTFDFRGNERLTLPYLISKKQINESVNFTIMRHAKTESLSFKLIPFINLIPFPNDIQVPTYYIHGGLVFTILSSDLLMSWGKRWWEQAPVNMTYFLLGDGRLNLEFDRELVVLLNVLSDDINAGYHGQGNEIVSKVNGEGFSSFREFVLLLDKVKKAKPFTIVETKGGTKYILSNQDIDLVDREIINRNNIPAQYSQDVADWLNHNE
ncbi:MAG: trypsin-like peptidase domain-containing protein [Candidatus Omnitrophota bacterium]